MCKLHSLNLLRLAHDNRQVGRECQDPLKKFFTGRGALTAGSAERRLGGKQEIESRVENFLMTNMVLDN